VRRRQGLERGVNLETKGCALAFPAAIKIFWAAGRQPSAGVVPQDPGRLGALGRETVGPVIGKVRHDRQPLTSPMLGAAQLPIPPMGARSEFTQGALPPGMPVEVSDCFLNTDETLFRNRLKRDPVLSLPLTLRSKSSICF